MHNIQKQCQTQLELEQAVITARLQAPTFPDETSGFDTVRQEVLQRMWVKLQSIEHTLKHLADGRFGLCRECQQPIDPERLLALPYAELCINCQRQLERTTIRRYRLRQLSSTAAG